MAKRAGSIEAFQERMSHFISPEATRYAQAFRPRPTDVIIATYPKAGTTWMQQIVHGLRTRGDMDFDEITAVTPWIETAADLGWDLEAEQKAAPRAFKSHWNADQTPRGCRRICVVRDPADTMLSFYNFMNGWFLERDAVSADAFARYIADREHPNGSYWEHLMSFWRVRSAEDVLLVAFEDLKADLAREVGRVARFIGLGHDRAAIEIATRQAHFEFMKAHEPQFDDHLVAAARNPACGLPADARSTKVSSGRVGGARGALSAATLELLDRKWAEWVAPETGCADYAALRAALSPGWPTQRA